MIAGPPIVGADGTASSGPADELVTNLSISVENAVLMALENNRSLQVERLNPSLQRTLVTQERAAFDPVVEANTTAGRGVAGPDIDTSNLSIGIAESLPSGTRIEAGISATETSGGGTEQHSASAEMSITQALLRGRRFAANIADVRQAELDVDISELELRGFTETLVAEVETRYWEFVLARMQTAIVEDSLKIGQQQREETELRVRVGTLAETELAAANAELSLRREALINARSQEEALQVRLLRMIHPRLLAGPVPVVALLSKPMALTDTLDPLADHIAAALTKRPDVRQARLLAQRGDLELVKTRNGLLPKLDIFINIGRTSYAESFNGTLRDLDDGDHAVTTGLSFQFPVLNRAARAARDRAQLTQQQLAAALANMEDLVLQDVELAYISVKRAREQVDATASTRALQEEKLRAETAKFRAGKSTAFFVAQAQRDLLASNVAEVAAITNELNARAQLYLMDGTLLDRRGITISGA